MGVQGERPGLGDEPAHSADLGDELHDGVLANDGVVEDGGVECSTGPPGQGPALVDHLAHHLEDALGPLAGPQLVAPQREHGRVKAPVVGGRPQATFQAMFVRS